MPDRSLPVLDISLRSHDGASFEIELRFDDPINQASDRLVAPCGPFDHAWYRKNELKASETGDYGKQLGRDLLGNDQVKTKLKTWVIGAQAAGGGASPDQRRALRVRLYIESSALLEASLRWETLCDPETGDPLFNGERYYFSRFLTSAEWSIVRQRTRSDLRALVAVANPPDLKTRLGLAAIDFNGELSRAKANLHPIPVPAALTPDSPDGRATLANVCQQLRDGRFDVLYLVCHGQLVDDNRRVEPIVYLEGDDGLDAVDAGRFILELSKLATLPRLIVLASCQSAGTGQTGPSAADAQADGADRTSDIEGALPALAPRLATAGVPAVVAMQGNILMKTVEKFMPVFFSELSKDGSIDRAMAVARGTIGAQNDYWAPVLFTRLRDASIWYEPGFAGGKAYDAWGVQVRYGSDGTCVPLLGPGMLDHLLGSQREIARKFAEEVNFPLASSDRDNLPTVAQYMTMKENAAGAVAKYQKWMRDALRTRYPDLPKGKVPVNDLLMQAGALARKENEFEPHKALASARFNCSLYVTTNPDTLLEAALEEAGRKPTVDYLRWYKNVDEELENMETEWTLPWDLAVEGGARPTAKNPLVYHLFGLWTVPQSLVLSEDDYFKYLIGATFNKSEAPPYVFSGLASLPLLFLGFHIDEWIFRVLFQQLKCQQGNQANLVNAAMAGGMGQRKVANKRHIGAQIGPDQDRMLDLAGARQTFQDDFKNNQIDLYWGSVEDFTKAFLEAAAKEDADE